MPRHPTDRASLERDCDVEYVNAGGPGGQHANKSETGIRLTHRATGLVVTATERRSRKRNLDSAFDRMSARLTELQRVAKPRRATRPTKASRVRRLDTKKRLSEKKSSRQWKPE